MTRNRARHICEEAARLVGGERLETYGDMNDNMALVADLWSIWLGVDINGHDVATMMELLKIARRKAGYKHDNYVDAAGYAGVAGQVGHRD